MQEIASTEDLKFFNEISTAKKYISLLKSQNVSIIILLTHCGLDRDKEIARNVDGIDIIVGGHSHTHMYSGRSLGLPDIPTDVYPSVVERGGQKTLIVHTSGHAKYVGLLRVKFNAAGEVIWWTGNPVFLSNDVEQDAETEKELAKWRVGVGKSLDIPIGNSLSPLLVDTCKVQECTLGNLMVDSMVHAVSKCSSGRREFLYLKFSLFKWHNKLDTAGNPFTLSAFLNSGAIRTSLSSGDITYGDLLTLSPFSNSIDMIKVSGGIIWRALEHAVAKKEENVFRGFLQVSGVRVAFDVTRAVGNRVVSVDILNPKTSIYEPVKQSQDYYVVINSFMEHGGDGFTMFQNSSFVE